MYFKKTTKQELYDAYKRYLRGGISKKKLGKELGLSEPTIIKRFNAIMNGTVDKNWFYDEDEEDGRDNEKSDIGH